MPRSGSTSGPKSGELAGQIARDVIDWYVATAEDVTAETLTAQLRQIHGSLSKRFPRDTASYVIVCLAGTGPALVLHAGDCLLGRQAGKSPLQWLIRPHTLANVIDDIPVAEIAESYARHRLTRSFRAREFMLPDVTEIKVEQGSSLVAATDGFWAELNSEEQAMLMRGQISPMIGEVDDRSILTIRLLDNEQRVKLHLSEDRLENFYIGGQLFMLSRKSMKSKVPMQKQKRQTLQRIGPIFFSHPSIAVPKMSASKRLLCRK